MENFIWGRNGVENGRSPSKVFDDLRQKTFAFRFEFPSILRRNFTHLDLQKQKLKKVNTTIHWTKRSEGRGEGGRRGQRGERVSIIDWLVIDPNIQNELGRWEMRVNGENQIQAYFPLNPSTKSAIWTDSCPKRSIFFSFKFQINFLLIGFFGTSKKNFLQIHFNYIEKKRIWRQKRTKRKTKETSKCPGIFYANEAEREVVECDQILWNRFPENPPPTCVSFPSRREKRRSLDSNLPKLSNSNRWKQKIFSFFNFQIKF